MSNPKIGERGVKAIFARSVIQIVGRPIYWTGFLLLPLFLFLVLTSMLDRGLPTRVPAAILDCDCSSLSREITQN